MSLARVEVHTHMSVVMSVDEDIYDVEKEYYLELIDPQFRIVNRKTQKEVVNKVFYHNVEDFEEVELE